MPWCPECRTEYDPGIQACADCGAALVDSLPEEEDPVVVLDAVTQVEAQIAEATLEAEGIPAFVQAPTVALPGQSISDDDSPDLEVLVPADLADEAEAVLNAPPISEEELAEVSGMENEEPGETA